MGKISIKSKIVSDEDNISIEVVGIKTKNKIVYKENNIKVTILIFDNKIEMNRYCNDYEINLLFQKGKKNISTYKIFGGTKVFELETITKKLSIRDNKVLIEYELEGNGFKYTLEMEEL